MRVLPQWARAHTNAARGGPDNRAGCARKQRGVGPTSHLNGGTSRVASDYAGDREDLGGFNVVITHGIDVVDRLEPARQGTHTREHAWTLRGY
jgi:hypothetical protein